MSNLSNRDDKDNIRLTSEDGQFNLVIGKDRLARLFRDWLSTAEEISKRLSGTFDIQKQDIQELYQYINDRLNDKFKAELSSFSGVTYFNDGSSEKVTQISKFVSEREKNYKPAVVTSIKLSFVYLLQINDDLERMGIEIIFNTEEGRIPGKNLDSDADRPVCYSEISVRYSRGTWSYDVLNWLVEYVSSKLGKQNSLFIFIENYHPLLSNFSTILFTSLYWGFIGAFSANSKGVLGSLLQKTPLKTLTLDQKVDILLKYFANLLETNGIQVGVSTFAMMGGFVIALSLGQILVAFLRRAIEPTPSFIRFNDASENHRRKCLRRVKYMWTKFICSLAGALILNILASYIYAYFSR
jgi:hypothetical protein